MGHCFISEEKEQPGESIERVSVYERGKGMSKGETGVKSLTPLRLCFPIYKMGQHYLLPRTVMTQKLLIFITHLKRGRAQNHYSRFPK